MPRRKPTRICGIDFSTFQIDLFFLPLDPDDDDVVPYAHACITMRSRHRRPGTSWDACVSLRHSIPVLPEWKDTKLAFIERGRGPSRNADWALGRIQGALAVVIPKRVRVYECETAEWKVAYLGKGKGNAPKAEVEVKGRSLGYDLADDNAYDALGIAWGMRAKNAAAAGIA